MNKSFSTFQIFINTFTGINTKTLVLDVSNNVTIKDIKNMIWNLIGIPVNSQHIKYGVKYIDDNDTLLTCNICKESTLNISLKLAGGGKNKKTARSKNRKKLNKKRELLFKTHGQEYAQVIKILGDGKMSVFCCDGITRLGIIRGKMRKRVWIHIDDYVLVSLREFQKDKCDIIFKYTGYEVRDLTIYGEIPDVKNIGDLNNSEKECAFDFNEV